MDLCYISVDIEGSHGKGHAPPVLNVISIGACVVGGGGHRFYIELRPMSEHWDPEAEKVHKISREHLVKYGSDPVQAMQAFSTWVSAASAGRRPVFCATPLSYDWKNVDWYLRHFSVGDPFADTLDGRALYRRIRGLKDDEEVPRDKIWGEFPPTLPHTHNALDDALEQAQVFEGMLREAKLI